MPAPWLTIVVPAYNESVRLVESLEKIWRFIARSPESVELILVDDGSTDRTPDLMREFQSQHRETRVLRNESNRGKGYSVRRGALEARGELILFTDSDMSAPIEEADKLVHALKDRQADAAIGSRALDRSLIGVHQSWRRETSGKVFNLIVRLITGLPQHDTQCGFKLFRRSSARPAFEMQRIDGFGFDPEVLFLIRRTGGKIVEVPVRWNNNPATKVRFLRDSARMLLDLVAIRWRAATGKYRSPIP